MLSRHNQPADLDGLTVLEAAQFAGRNRPGLGESITTQIGQMRVSLVAQHNASGEVDPIAIGDDVGEDLFVGKKRVE